MNIVTVSTIDFLLTRDFLHSLAQNGCTVRHCSSLEDFHRFLVEEHSAECVITSDSDLSLIKELIKRYPTLNYAVVSPLDQQKLHERTEGYGIFMQLPENPGAEDARQLLAGIERWSKAVFTDKGEA